MEEPCGVEPMETYTKVLFKNTCCALCMALEVGKKRSLCNSAEAIVSVLKTSASLSASS